MVSKTRIYHKEGSGTEDETRLAMDAISKAQFRKAEKKQERLKRIADSSENPKAATEVQMVTKELVQCLKNKDFDSKLAKYFNKPKVQV